MDLDPAGNSPKRSRSKAKAAAESAATPAPRAATPRTRKTKPSQAAPVIEVTSITAIATPDDDELLGMIATAAYYIAERRHFEPGHELEDWLAAERQIRAIHA